MLTRSLNSKKSWWRWPLLFVLVGTLCLVSVGCGDDSSGGGDDVDAAVSDPDGSAGDDAEVQADAETDGGMEQDGDVEMDGGTEDPYTPDMVEGEWWIHNLSTGAWKGWNYANVTIDASGAMSDMEFWDSDGGNDSVADPGFNLTLETDGSLTGDFDQDVEGFLSADGMSLVMTGDDADGDDRMLNMGLMTGSGVYEQAQLTGEWYVTVLSVADPATMGSWTGWARGTAALDSTGTMTTLQMDNSDGALLTDPIPGFQLVMDPDGSITNNGSSSYHGYLSHDGSLVAATNTAEDGSLELHIYQIVSDATFDVSDLQGRWYLSVLSVGQWEAWMRGIITVDATGVITDVSLEDSEGGLHTDPPTTAPLALDSDGVLTSSQDASWRGFMSGDKNLIVYTNTVTTGGSSYELNVLQRIP